MKRYVLSSSLHSLNHFSSTIALCRDDADSSADDFSRLIIQARIRSGDYFSTVAAELEQLIQHLKFEGIPEASELERIVNEMLYLEKNYEVTAKPKR